MTCRRDFGWTSYVIERQLLASSWTKISWHKRQSLKTWRMSIRPTWNKTILTAPISFSTLMDTNVRRTVSLDGFLPDIYEWAWQNCKLGFLWDKTLFLASNYPFSISNIRMLLRKKWVFSLMELTHIALIFCSYLTLKAFLFKAKLFHSKNEKLHNLGTFANQFHQQRKIYFSETSFFYSFKSSILILQLFLEGPVLFFSSFSYFQLFWSSQSLLLHTTNS